jgi:hypothetical protein
MKTLTYEGIAHLIPAGIGDELICLLGLFAEPVLRETPGQSEEGLGFVDIPMIDVIIQLTLKSAPIDITPGPYGPEDLDRCKKELVNKAPQKIHPLILDIHIPILIKLYLLYAAVYFKRMSAWLHPNSTPLTAHCFLGHRS